MQFTTLFNRASCAMISTALLGILTSSAAAFGPPPPALTLASNSTCYQTGATVTVNINMTNPGQAVVGGQFFLGYDTSKLTFSGITTGSAPFTQEVYRCAPPDPLAPPCVPIPGLIDYAVGVPFLTPGTSANTTMAVVTFTASAGICNAAGLVYFRPHTPPTQLTNSVGDPIAVVQNDMNAIRIDGTAPTLTCPPNVTVECDPSDPYALPGSLLGTAVGGVEIEYNIGQPETPLQQSYLKAQLSHTNTNGMHLTFNNALLPPYNFPGLTWATLFGQVTPSQFGFDMVLPAPTNVDPIPFLNAYDNVNNNCVNATATPNFIWALNDYNALGGPTVNNCVINSLFRSAGLSPTAVTVTKNILTLSGTVYTVQIGGILQSDNFIHWFNPATPNSPVSNFLLSGKLYFDGTLTYNSLGDPGNDGDFYAGTITLSFNSPYTGANAVGIPSVSDNCDPQPLVTFSDVTTPGTCPQEKTIQRTWLAVDTCGNTTTCAQTITVQDSMPPVFTFCPPNIGPINADAGGCTADVNVETATIVDCCDPIPLLVASRSDLAPLNDPFPVGVTTVTWTATDACGNQSTCMHTVTVNAFNTMQVSVHLAGGPATWLGSNFTRCVRFELRRCGFPGVTISDHDINFVNGQANGLSLNVPCGLYDCITARDRKHSLRRTDDTFVPVGLNYVADFTLGDSLVCGNLNDDFYIDILDFGIFVGQYNTGPGANTLCGYLGNHADISGDGVVFTEDFTFIQLNFLYENEANCCGLAGGPIPMANGDDSRFMLANPPSDKPITKISVRELQRRGLHELAKGDLNRDGWLDTTDVAVFLTQGMP